ncbi:peptidoglycan-associated lipoprotein Pal [Rhodovulum sp. BSW8]|uniref:Peptidoglycan-associated lipoprotein n=1 Tax=Rhodovulum visakhapatnamense TaxID=364297 RepID=A0A4R8FVJ5_9RHOB|nr:MULTISPECIES: peptidoglycan-associated lipoprotein Pal [Rhodovulum]OLS44520.1 peptidoglycan-associated lipoprotein [Rhodovulum sulfidophilum]MBL3571993.1 peptidoglycan-associated lipoprotein Pal [Rhodovulum visakhapatnamense]MBL3578004.1 peptidoglycan-associated lipoprotein Pal [Rhodovulum visakhapatnamense]RBO53478.1 peptidoglycan-associated lipoprotein Pal [Rhodovulum sp. BSW8]TDX28212.1 peptidoglycan-associated lipoprotein [Rhodovulum visakhapatnamense]
MTRITTSILLMTALAVSACSNADRFGSASGAGGAGGAYGANGSPSDPTSVAYFNQTIGDRVLFLVDQSTLSPDATVTLDGQANWMNQNTAYSATIEGHADEQGTREYNLALGARRANAVKEYLVSRGVSPNRLQTVTYGKERPIAICSEESCYAKNRRAVTVLAAGAGF